MRFLADESCDFAAVRALRSAGFDVATVRERAAGATDRDVIRLATAEERILLTEDKDFGRLVFVSAERSPGVVLIRFPSRHRSELPESIVSLARTRGEQLVGRFAVVQPGRVRFDQR